MNEYNKEKYRQAVSELIPWMKQRIGESDDVKIRVRIEDIKNEMGHEFLDKTDSAIFKDLRYILFDEGLFVTKGRHKDGSALLIFRIVSQRDRPPRDPGEGDIETVPGISEIGDMPYSENFDIEEIAKIAEENKDIILKVEPINEDSLDVYINLDAEKQRLVDGIVDMFNRFHATSVDLDYKQDGVRILGFQWD